MAIESEEDAIRDVVAQRAESLGTTAYAIAKTLEMSPETVKRYLAGRCSWNTRYVSRIAAHLGLELRPKE